VKLHFIFNNIEWIHLVTKKQTQGAILGSILILALFLSVLPQQSLLFQNLDLKVGLQMLVIDEADLVFSYGYEYDLKTLLRYMYIFVT